MQRMLSQTQNSVILKENSEQFMPLKVRRARWRRMRKTLLLQLPETTSLKVVELIQIKRKGKIRKNMGEANQIGLIMNAITVALSSTEAEYMSACSAAQEAVYLRVLLEDLKHPQNGPTVLHQDNQGAIALGSDFISNKRTKHIDIKYHFIREKVEEGVIKLQYTPTIDMVADCLTKPVGRQIMDRAKVQIFG